MQVCSDGYCRRRSRDPSFSSSESTHIYTFIYNSIYVYICQVLHEVIKSQMRTYLTDAAAWDIVESCYAVLVRGSVAAWVTYIYHSFMFI